MACSSVSRLMGGSTPKASQVRKTTLRGCPAQPPRSTFESWVRG